MIIKWGVFPFSQGSSPKSPVVDLCLKTCERSCTDFFLKGGCLFAFDSLFFPLSIHFKFTVVPAYSYGNRHKLALFSFSLHTSNTVPVSVTWQTLIRTVPHLVVIFSAAVEIKSPDSFEVQSIISCLNTSLSLCPT